MTIEAHERPRSDLSTSRVTFLFTDIENSRRGRSMDPEEVFLTDGLAERIP